MRGMGGGRWWWGGHRVVAVKLKKIRRSRQWKKIRPQWKKRLIFVLLSNPQTCCVAICAVDLLAWIYNHAHSLCKSVNQSWLICSLSIYLSVRLSPPITSHLIAPTAEGPPVYPSLLALPLCFSGLRVKMVDTLDAWRMGGGRMHTFGKNWGHWLNGNDVRTHTRTKTH